MDCQFRHKLQCRWRQINRRAPLAYFIYLYILQYCVHCDPVARGVYVLIRISCEWQWAWSREQHTYVHGKGRGGQGVSARTQTRIQGEYALTVLVLWAFYWRVCSFMQTFSKCLRGFNFKILFRSQPTL